MEFFNDLSKRFSNVAKSVSEKTRDSMESSRLASDLRSQRNLLEQLYTELGKVCYAVRMGDGDAGQVETLTTQIQGTLNRIEELSAMRDIMRDVRRCPSCGAVMPREARFCSNCGKRMPEDAPRPEPENKDEFCPECGAQRVGGERFCSVCGRSFEAAKPAPEDINDTAEISMDVQDIEEPQDYEN